MPMPKSFEFVVNYKGALFAKNMEKRINQNLDRAALYLEGQIKKVFQAGPEPSEPGEPPAVQTGRLLGSITWDSVGRFTRRVGSSLKPQRGFPSYALMLEYGTRNMFRRPWLRVTLDQSKAQLRKILARK
jgi:hypothetical protein